MNAEWQLGVAWCRIRPGGRGTAISIAAVVAAAGLLVLAAALIGNARIRRRRAANAVSLDALLADRLAHPGGGPDFWAGMQPASRRAVDPDPERVTLADRLEVLCDRAESRPKLAEDIEIKEFHLRWGNDYALIANPRDLLHYRLEPGEVEILPLLDGDRTVKEIVVDRLQDSGDFELGGVADLVQQLKVGGFLDTPFLDAEAAVDRAIAPESTIASKVKKFTKTLSVEWMGADRLVRWIYDHVLFWIFSTPVIIVFALVAGIGLLAFLDVFFSGDFAFSGTAVAAASLILIALDWVLTFCHELGHAIVMVHQGRRVKSAGFMIYFGSPAFFVESSDGLMVDPPKRVRQSFAGPFAELIIAGIASMYVWTFPGAPGATVLFKFAVLNYFVVLLNLVPLLELDGYYILSDLIHVPDLRERSLSFMRDDVPRKLRHWDGLTKQDVGLGVYSVLGLAFTIFCLWTSVFFWRQVFGGLISELWNGGLWTRLLLLALGLFLLGPILRGLIALARAAFARLRALWRRIVFRVQTSWRVEAAELIDALPTFDDLPGDVLSDLAGRVQLRSFPEGKPVVRQGERARGFYVVRNGTLQVVEELPDGAERALRVLGRGESFGELGLVGTAPRAATVRALERSEVFEIDKGTFDHLLSQSVHLPDFGPTVQAALELRELPAFDHLELDELSELLEHGSWRSIGPGEVVIEQGQVGDTFYALGSGRVDVIRDGEPVGDLGPGEYFGEIALLLQVPRTASVVARTPGRVFELEREGFDRLVGRAFKGGTLKPHTGADRTATH